MINELLDTSKSVTQELKNEFFSNHGVSLFVKRDDLIDQEISGNKWRKLKYNVELCRRDHFDGILTFGGAFSNHLVATASACHKAGLSSFGIVRGDELNATSNETLKRCAEYGMILKFVTRDLYAQRNEKSYQDALSYEFPNHLVVPEGGANYYGILGCQEIMDEVTEDVDVIFVAQGTTTTSLGIASSLKEHQRLAVVPVLKGFASKEEMGRLLKKSAFEEEYINEVLQNIDVYSQYHFGGYGKYNEELLLFIKDFYRDHGIKLDPIYTGKVMFAIHNLIESGRLEGKSILFVHTGGVQGSASIIERSGVQLYD
jgi:1-aminocyclopropane-1-carboxylate deaminase